MRKSLVIALTAIASIGGSTAVISLRAMYPVVECFACG
jgi:hypothetical protein